MNSRIRYLLLTGFTVAIVKCAAQQQTELDDGAVKPKSEIIHVPPLTSGSNTSKIVTNQLFLKSMMSYDVRMGPATSMVPIRFDYSATNSGRRMDAHHWQLGIEQAERVNLMQMNEYRWRNTTIPSSSTPETFYPSSSERMFNAK